MQPTFRQFAANQSNGYSYRKLRQLGGAPELGTHCSQVSSDSKSTSDGGADWSSCENKIAGYTYQINSLL